MAKKRKKQQTASVTRFSAIILAVLILAVIILVIRAAGNVNDRASTGGRANVQTHQTPRPTDTPTPLDTPAPTAEPTDAPENAEIPVPTEAPEAANGFVFREEAPNGHSSPYCIVVSKAAQLVCIYTLDENGQYTVPVKLMPASVSPENALENGLYFTNDSQRWLSMETESLYTQYATRIQDEVHFHSVPYLKAKPDSMSLEDYKKLGSAGGDGVTLLCADARWIYNHCRANTPVFVTDGEEYSAYRESVSIPEIVKKNKGWDPTDDYARNPYYQKPASSALPTPFPGASPAENPYSF